MNELKKILEGKSVFIKVDSCTHHNRSYLGVNVQFEMDSSIPVRTLAVKDWCGEHTSDQIKTLIQEVLTKFQIKRSLQLLVVVCDNAANMSKTVRLLNENEKNSEDELEMNSEDEDSEEMADIEENDDEFDYIEDYEESMEDEICHMRCAAHTLQ